MKKGDKVICKKNYLIRDFRKRFGDKVIAFLEGAKYEILYITDDTIVLKSFNDQIIYGRPSTIFEFSKRKSNKGGIKYKVPLFEDYFATEKEIRKNKLLKINQL